MEDLYQMWVYILLIAGGINVLIGYSLSWQTISKTYERTFEKSEYRRIYSVWILLATLAAASYLTIFGYGIIVRNGQDFHQDWFVPSLAVFMTGAISWSFAVSIAAGSSVVGARIDRSSAIFQIDKNRLTDFEKICISLTSFGSIGILISVCLDKHIDEIDGIILASALLLVLHHLVMDNIVWLVISSSNQGVDDDDSQMSIEDWIKLAYRLYFMPTIAGIVAVIYIKGTYGDDTPRLMPWIVVSIFIIGLHFVLGAVEAATSEDWWEHARERWARGYTLVADLLLIVGLVCGFAAVATNENTYQLTLASLALGVGGNVFCVYDRMKPEDTTGGNVNAADPSSNTSQSRLSLLDSL